MALRFHERESGIDKYPNVDPGVVGAVRLRFLGPDDRRIIMFDSDDEWWRVEARRGGAATDLMEQVGDALAAPRSAYVHVQRST